MTHDDLHLSVSLSTSVANTMPYILSHVQCIIQCLRNRKCQKNECVNRWVKEYIKQCGNDDMNEITNKQIFETSSFTRIPESKFQKYAMEKSRPVKKFGFFFFSFLPVSISVFKLLLI